MRDEDDAVDSNALEKCALPRTLIPSTSPSIFRAV
jgi:hypothetical protein